MNFTKEILRYFDVPPYFLQYFSYMKKPLLILPFLVYMVAVLCFAARGVYSFDWENIRRDISATDAMPPSDRLKLLPGSHSFTRKSEIEVEKQGEKVEGIQTVGNNSKYQLNIKYMGVWNDLSKCRSIGVK